MKIPLMKEGEITSTTVEDPITPTTTVKRMSPNGPNESINQPHLEGDISSTKVKKATKRGKNNKRIIIGQQPLINTIPKP